MFLWTRKLLLLLIISVNYDVNRNQFYQIFYGVFDDQSAAMDVLLNGKELFARQVRLLNPYGYVLLICYSTLYLFF